VFFCVSCVCCVRCVWCGCYDRCAGVFVSLFLFFCVYGFCVRLNGQSTRAPTHICILSDRTKQSNNKQTKRNHQTHTSLRSLVLRFHLYNRLCSVFVPSFTLIKNINVKYVKEPHTKVNKHIEVLVEVSNPVWCVFVCACVCACMNVRVVCCVVFSSNELLRVVLQRVLLLVLLLLCVVSFV